MTKFIGVHNHTINTKSISKIEFISDDIYIGDFPRDEDGKIAIDFMAFTFGSIVLFSGEEIELTIDLYQLEEGQSEEDWYKKNRSIINTSWDKLVGTLGDVTQITEYEYRC